MMSRACFCGVGGSERTRPYDMSDCFFEVKVQQTQSSRKGRALAGPFRRAQR